jgi:hypothetical protein
MTGELGSVLTGLAQKMVLGAKQINTGSAFQQEIDSLAQAKIAAHKNEIALLSNRSSLAAQSRIL